MKFESYLLAAGVLVVIWMVIICKVRLIMLTNLNNFINDQLTHTPKSPPLQIAHRRALLPFQEEG